MAAPAGPLRPVRLTDGFAALQQRARPAVFALGLMSVGHAQAWCPDATTRFPLRGVQALAVAAAALAKVDAGSLRLDEKIPIRDVDLSPPPSAIDHAWPTPPEGHAIALPAIDLIALALQHGDSTATDVIMGRIGGPGAVTAWLTAGAITDMRVDRYLRESVQDMAGMPSFRPAWKDEAAWIAARDALPPTHRQAAMNAFLADPRDTTTVPAALNLIDRLALGELLSAKSTTLLWRLMAGGGGASRFRAGLPAKATLSGVGGASRTDLGFTPVTGELALATFPDGRRLVMAAFLAGSTETEAQRDRLFADAGRLAVTAETL